MSCVALFLAGKFIEPATNFLPDTPQLHASEVIVNVLPGWEVSGEHPPLAASLVDIENRVDDFPALVDGFRSARIRSSDQVLDQLPLPVGQIG